jgi:hypothetical protein
VASFMLIVVSVQAPSTGAPGASASANTATIVVAAKDLPLAPSSRPRS